ncbi:hypothetical protein JRQ81_007161 [Phrynocephalus forsythii]|uniref:Uncharacterized protein n=1 Tax=Phrynocephalus forsythii TaxID=171643 RepID=A0A9Q0XEQ5_9SAUR|nr:hypothetical protein JRQ81_007161 [Phrynocephalus forsythii]
MSSQTLLCAIVALSAAFCSEALPVLPDIDSMQDFAPTDFNLMDNNVGFVSDDVPFTGLHQSRNTNPALLALEERINQIQKSSRWNGDKESLQEEAPDNLADEAKTILWKLAAADKLRSHAFVRADHSSPQKPSKRACFWKYCVTN